MTPSTVYDRSKVNGGFMTGPNHSIMGMSGEGQTVPPEQQSAAPNYRESDTTGQDCMSCQNLDMDSGQCAKYGFKPKLYFVCDTFQGEGEESEQPESLEEGSVIE